MSGFEQKEPQIELLAYFKEHRPQLCESTPVIMNDSVGSIYTMSPNGKFSDLQLRCALLIGSSVLPGGMVIICGTGSIGQYITNYGSSMRVGGWGHMLGEGTRFTFHMNYYHERGRRLKVGRSPLQRKEFRRIHERSHRHQLTDRNPHVLDDVTVTQRPVAGILQPVRSVGSFVPRTVSPLARTRPYLTWQRRAESYSSTSRYAPPPKLIPRVHPGKKRVAVCKRLLPGPQPGRLHTELFTGACNACCGT